MPDVLKTVGRYEILREVGRGGMAMVYLARQTDLDRFVALKELAAFHASDAAFAQRFLRESRVAGSLSHPNIVTVHDYFEHDGTPYIAMEYVERGSLRPYVGNMSLSQMGGVLEGLLAGLAHAEQHAIVHRDLKPENLMVTVDGRVKIADFGIAKATNQMQTGAFLTQTGTTVGTPTYMAPEQAMAQDIGPWTDLYSVGCMAFEMFTGHTPFHDSDAPMAILLRHVNEEIPPINTVDPSIDDGISTWVQKLLVKDPTKRTQSAGEAWDDLEEIIIGLQGPRWRRGARLQARADQVDTPKPLTPAPFEGTSAAQPSTSDEFQSFAWGQPVTETPPGGSLTPPAAPPPGPATPPPADAPSGPLQPGPIDVPTGPPTPPPLQPVGDDDFVTFGPGAAAPDAPAPPAEAPEARAADSAAPGAAPDVAAGREASPPADAAAGPDAPPSPAPPPAPPEIAAQPDGEEDSAFLTFGAPVPVEEPAAPAAEPPAPALEPAPESEAPVTEEPPAVEEPVEAFETFQAPAPPRPPTDDAPPPPPPAPEPVAPPPPPPAPEPEPVASAPAPEPVAATPSTDLGATMMPEVLKRREAEERKAKKKEKAAKPPKPPREKPVREGTGAGGKAFPIALGAVLVLAIIAGFALGGSGGDKSEEPAAPADPTPRTPAEAGPIALKLPAGFKSLDEVPQVPGLTLRDGAAFGSGQRAVLVGATGAKDATLLPPAFKNALGLLPGDELEFSAVKLGPDDLQAFKYPDLAPKDFDRHVTIYASPNSEGVMTVACLAPAGDNGFAGQCEAVADTLQVSGGKAFPVGADPAYAKLVGSTFKKLDGDVAKGIKALNKSGANFRAQAAAARNVQDAYVAAGKKLRGAETGPADRSANAAIVTALGANANAWKKAAAAAARKDKKTFSNANGPIKQARQKLSRALTALRANGYKIQS